MDLMLTSDLALGLLTHVLAAGWRVEIKELAPRAAKPWSNDNEMPGLELLAYRLRGESDRAIAVQVRDWSRARCEMEAVVMLAHRLGVDLYAPLAQAA